MKDILLLVGIILSIILSIFIAVTPFLYPIVKIFLFLIIGFGLHLVKKDLNKWGAKNLQIKELKEIKLLYKI